VFANWGEHIRNSGQRAFSELFNVMHAPLLRYAERFTGNREAARDVVQDAFLKLWQVRATIDPKRSLKSLMYTIVRNLSLNYIRSARNASDPLPLYGIDDGNPSAAMRLDASMREKYIKQFIDELPPRRREAFVLSRFHGLTHAEIAKEMNLTSRTVNTHIVLALRYLRGRLGGLDS